MRTEVKTVNKSGGVGFCSLLAVVFIALKLTGHIAWSWWWVLAPLWAPPLIAVLILAVFAALVAWAKT